ncbi:MAG: acyl-CoA dehydrogenase family protein [Planctomycetes bacterium]|nr:acyl-CoA dehydrogenase family protein [Planctomycetota bacterium]
MKAVHPLLAELRARAKAAAQGTEARLDALSEREAALEALRIVRKAGLVAYTVPERDGGAHAGGLCTPETVSARALCALRDELAWQHGLLDLMLVEQGLGSFPVALGGTPELRAELLPAVASGERIAAFALTEPDAGSNLSDITTRATRTKHGWRLDGTKTFITNAGIAHFYTVLARTRGEPGEEGLSMFCVNADAKGLSVSPFEVLAPHPIGEVRFDAVEVQERALLGREHEGTALALATLARFRTGVAAAANGFARRALDESMAHLSRRKQFGRPLATFQALRFDVAEMDVRLRAGQLLVDEAAELVDEGGRASAAVARAKLFATENASWICDRAVQHFGGLGVKRGTVVERLFRDTRALRIYEGTSEIQRLVLARELFGGRG